MMTLWFRSWATGPATVALTKTGNTKGATVTFHQEARYKPFLLSLSSNWSFIHLCGFSLGYYWALVSEMYFTGLYHTHQNSILLGERLIGWLSVCEMAQIISVLGRSPGEGDGNPLQYSCLGKPMDRGAWWATVRGVANSLGTTEEVRHSISFDIIVNLLCVKSSTHIALS